jgi:3-dehydroquinate dehydratase
MKPTFYGHEKPLLAAMVYEPTPMTAKATMRNAIYDGADAFCIDLNVLGAEFHTEEHLKSIFAVAEDKPIYSYFYRRTLPEGSDDEPLAEMCRRSIKCGSTLCDLMGDMFEKGAPNQLAMAPEAVEKQKRLIDEIHEMGGEVLMSTHIFRFFSLEETLKQAKEMEARGADVVKIVVTANSREEEEEVFRTTMALRNEIKKPFLHLCMGRYGKVHRALTPVFGSCMTLCVQYYNKHSVFDQPLLRATRAVYDNIDFDRGFHR